MSKPNYAASHGIVSISAKRFEASPFTEKYATADIVYGIYAGRFYALTLGEDPIEYYWKLRKGVVLYDVPEKPLEIRGPQALDLLEKVFCRRIANLRTWRARYAVACTPQGGTLMDGVVIRLADDHFWYVTADGDFEPWLLAHAAGLDVTVRDPRSRVLQVQGPDSLRLLAAAADEVPENFRYFHAGRLVMGGQPLLVSRTGWTGELGFEIYAEAGVTDHAALWDHLMRHGEPFGMVASSLESMGIRRIEAGILDNGTDMDVSMTPYEAGLGNFVELDKGPFIGRDALLRADRRPLLHGLETTHTVPFAGLEVRDGSTAVARMTCGAWSPSCERGVGFVRFSSSGDWLGRELSLIDREGRAQPCKVVPLPFLDPEKKLARGMA